MSKQLQRCRCTCIMHKINLKFGLSLSKISNSSPFLLLVNMPLIASAGILFCLKHQNAHVLSRFKPFVNNSKALLMGVFTGNK